MADSEDEYDRKRRDKFRGERAEASSYRGTDRLGVRPRAEEWVERDTWSRGRPRDYRSMRDRGYSPSMDPTAKRMRHDYYGDAGFYNHYPPYHPPSHREAVAPASSHGGSDGQQPVMMSFKAFLSTQDDNISDSEAIEKYNDYKLEFQRQQLNEFFVTHKDEEWFRIKYHPEESVKRKEEQMNSMKKRLSVFLELLNNNKLSMSIDCSRTNELLKLLDTFVIKLEGGNEEDLIALDEEYEELMDAEKPKVQSDVICPPKSDNTSKTGTGVIIPPSTNGKEEIKPTAEKDINGKIDGDSVTVLQGDKPELPITGEHPTMDDVPMLDGAVVEHHDPAEADVKENQLPDEEKPRTPKRKRSTSSRSSSSSSSSSTDNSEDEGDVASPSKKSDPKQIEKVNDENTQTELPKISEDNDDKIEDKAVETTDARPIEVIDVKEEEPIKAPLPKRRTLHKTTSIFLRTLASTITKGEIEAVCRRYDDFLRVALADPQPERRWMRRGWVTFRRDANIKEICWSFNNVRLRDTELGAIVNRDLSRRVRPVNGLTADKQVVRSDIKISSKMVVHLDTKAGLWSSENDEEEDGGVENGKKVAETSASPSFGMTSNNPVLQNITDYLIEEASAEEDELLGLQPASETTASVVERDDELIKVLDRIIFYLRLVHSVDYYNHCEYPNEDEMPNRCGIIHARGPPPTTKTDLTPYLGATVETKLANFLPEKGGEGTKEGGVDSKLLNVSLKDVDTEIDKFVQANTRELAKDKWLCPLSGKKFKGPDFVRKHLFNKHAEKIEEVKKEVEFFNNYLRDPKRPMMSEAQPPVSKREEQPVITHHSYGGGGPGGSGGAPGNGGYSGYGRMMPYYNGYPRRQRGGYASRGRGGVTDFRPVIHYRDLDAPREPEEFI